MLESEIFKREELKLSIINQLNKNQQQLKILNDKKKTSTSLRSTQRHFTVQDIKYLEQVNI